MENKQVINTIRVKCSGCRIGAGPQRKCEWCSNNYCACCAKWYTVVSIWYIPKISFDSYGNQLKIVPKTTKKSLTTDRLVGYKKRSCDICLIKKKEGYLLSHIRNNREQKLYHVTGKQLTKHINHIILLYLYASAPKHRDRKLSNSEKCCIS